MLPEPKELQAGRSGFLDVVEAKVGGAELKRETKSEIRKRETHDWRYNFCARVGRCEHCLLPASVENLCCDEIARGSGLRQKALDKPFAFLVVRVDHHDLIQNWSRAKRLAVLYLARSTDYDLDAFHALTARHFPDQNDVDAEVSLLLKMRSER